MVFIELFIVLLSSVSQVGTTKPVDNSCELVQSFRCSNFPSNCNCAEPQLNCDVCNDDATIPCSQCNTGYFRPFDNYRCVSCSQIFGDLCKICTNDRGCQQCEDNSPPVRNECGLYTCGRLRNISMPIETPAPTFDPSRIPSNIPSNIPSSIPSAIPSAMPTLMPVYDIDASLAYGGAVTDFYEGTDCDGYLDNNFADGAEFCWGGFDRCFNRSEVQDRFCGLCNNGTIFERSVGALDWVSETFGDERITMANVYRCCLGSIVGLIDFNYKATNIRNTDGLIVKSYHVFRNSQGIVKAVEKFLNATVY